MNKIKIENNNNNNNNTVKIKGRKVVVTVVILSSGRLGHKAQRLILRVAWISSTPFMTRE